MSDSFVPPDLMKTTAAITALAAAGLEASEVRGHHWLMVPPNYVHKDITDLVEKAQPTPSRKRGTVTVKDVASLLAYAADQDSKAGGYIYADPDSCTLTAVFNDNKAAVAEWRDHRATYKAEFTPEFQKWKSASGQQMEQATFAEFIEDNMADIVPPYAATLMEVATTISAKTDINFSSSKRLDNGQVQLNYVETLDAKAGVAGGLTIPREFELGLRLFKNGDGYKLRARLKYRLNAGAVKFWFELDRPERAVEDAFSGYIDTVREKSGYTVLIGTP